jgi:hypothetical protein
MGLPLFIIQSSNTLITYVYRPLSFRPSSACYFPRTIIQTADEIIPCTRITQIERAHDVHLYHIIGVFHFKSFVFPSLKLTFEGVKIMSFYILYMVLVLKDSPVVLFSLNFILLQSNLLVNRRSSIVSSTCGVIFSYLMLCGLLKRSNSPSIPFSLYLFFHL